MKGKIKAKGKMKMRHMIKKYGAKPKMLAAEGEEYVNKPSEFLTRDIPNAVKSLPGRVSTALFGNTDGMKGVNDYGTTDVEGIADKPGTGLQGRMDKYDLAKGTSNIGKKKKAGGLRGC
jgi:hypothetical protein